MRTEEIQAERAIDLSPHNHAFLNPYNGCAMGCPFCFWLSDPAWENRMQVKQNIAELLEVYLREQWDGDYLYLGSVCDPFAKEEETCGLTGRCLELLKKYQVPLLITTSAASPVILSYTDLLKSMKGPVITVVELSRIPFVEEMNRGNVHPGIDRANRLREAGLTVWATLSPVLPGITDLEQVLAALDPRIPVYVDRLNMTADSVQGRRTLAWIERDYPQLYARYEGMICGQEWSYFEELLARCRGNERVKTFPFQLEKVQ